MTAFKTFDQVLELLGAFVPLCSILASWINQTIRSKMETGTPVSGRMLRLGSILNAAGINLDKAVVLGRMARAHYSRPVEDAPAEEPVEPAVELPVEVEKSEPECATLESRVDVLEAMVATLQKKQAKAAVKSTRQSRK